MRFFVYAFLEAFSRCVFQLVAMRLRSDCFRSSPVASRSTTREVKKIKIMPSTKFSVAEDENLIENIRNYSALYDPEVADYKNIEVKDNIWVVISKVVGKTPEECKARWRNIRDTYLRQRKKSKGKTGDPARKKNKWQLFDHLTFLNSVKQERRSFCNIPKTGIEDEESSELPFEDEEIGYLTPSNSPKHSDISYHEDTAKTMHSEASSSCSNVVKKKRKTITDFQKRSDERLQAIKALAQTNNVIEDDVDLFMRSIALSVKKMPTTMIAQAKMSILSVITELEKSAILPHSTTYIMPVEPTATTTPFLTSYAEVDEGQTTFTTYNANPII